MVIGARSIFHSKSLKKTHHPCVTMKLNLQTVERSDNTKEFFYFLSRFRDPARRNMGNDSTGHSAGSFVPFCTPDTSAQYGYT